MAGKLIELKDAASMLGVSPEQLTEMRSRGKIFGYRDGPNWKFKEEEVQRVAAEMGTGDAGLGDDDLLNVSDLDADDSILVSEEALGASPEGTSSTIIGKTEKPASESDIQLTSDSAVNKGGKPGSGKGSDVALVLDDSGLSVKPGSGKSPGSTGVGGSLPGLSDLGILDSNSDIEKNAAGSGLSLGEDVELTLGSGKSGAGSGKGGSNISLDDDDELVLGGTGKGSDVGLSAGDSGINLSMPSESGLSLEQPVNLAGSAIDAFELGEDSELISLDENADPDAATQLKADDEFLLTPVEGQLDDSDSGSQVIALDESASDMAEAPTLLGAATGAALLEEAPAATATAADLARPLAPVQAYEAPYSIWNVLSLFCIVSMLAVTGIMMSDLLRQMWSWDQPHNVSSALMDKIIDAIGLNK